MTQARRFARFALLVCATLLAPSLACAEAWTSVGPFGALLANNDVISGQVNALAVDPRDANVVYLGASEGGVWKTRDGGASWIPLTDTQLVRRLPSGVMKGTMSIGALAINPSNPQAIYAGTGDPNIACCFVGAALGVFRSVDGGGTWVPTGADPAQPGCENGAVGQAVVNRLLVVPGRPTRVLAATDVGLFSYPEDGTDCWRRLTNGLPISGNAIDLVADPYKSALYLAMRSQGIFKSDTLDGAQWKMLAGGLPTSGFGRIALAFGGRTGVGFSQPLPLVYAGFDALGTYKLFKTIDGGTTWTELPMPPSDGQLDFNNTIAVGDYSSDEVYIGQIAFWRAVDGGRTGGRNDYRANPPVTTNSWTPLGCCLSHPNPFRTGLDLHADLHAIVFAPYGSFVPTPQEVQRVYVANDGGVTQGSIDFEGVVHWKALSKGLALGQAGTIGLDPGLAGVSVGGYWHNGDILSLTSNSEALAIFGGDGFQTSIDAGSLIVYFNCNAGFGGSICRALPPAPFFTNFLIEKIWSDQASSTLWSDPHRPGHLLRLQNGLVFRATAANTASAATLDTAASWQAVEPPSGKTGNTTTVAFRSRLMEAQPVYYLGTDTGQIWRGSPEAGWLRLCECGAKVNAIGVDLFSNERIFAVLDRTTSPGRVKEITRGFRGRTWDVRDVDGGFDPPLAVKKLTSIVVDPAVPRAQGTTIYVGSDQGVYRGRAEPPVIQPADLATEAAGGQPAERAPAVPLPLPVFENWTWRRSPGVPNVWVSDLEVHQSFVARDASGIIRAGTYGRGIFELNRAVSGGVFEKPPIVLSVQALQVGEDGAPPPVSVSVTIVTKDGKYARTTPFDLAFAGQAQVTLEAPRELRTRDAVLEFSGWFVPGRRPDGSPRITLDVAEAARAVAYYEGEEQAHDPKAPPLSIDASATGRDVCVQSLTHEIVVTWAIHGGQRPATARVAIQYPDGHVEHFELKPIEGSQAFPLTYPKGGSARVTVTATDAAGARDSARGDVLVDACT
jgi:hypothetical protein